MKAQTQALSAVLITTVTIGTIASAYVWGSPLLEKRQGQAETDSVERGVTNLKQTIDSVARGGEGSSESISIAAPNGDIEIDSSTDSIDITTTSDDPRYPQSWVLIDGTNMQNLTIGTGSYGIVGEDQPGVIAAKTLGSGENSRITYRIEYRNMYTDEFDNIQMEKIDLDVRGRESVTEEAEIQITNEGRSQDTVVIDTGQEIQRTKTDIVLDIQ